MDLLNSSNACLFFLALLVIALLMTLLLLIYAKIYLNKDNLFLLYLLSMFCIFTNYIIIMKQCVYTTRFHVYFLFFFPKSLNPLSPLVAISGFSSSRFSLKKFQEKSHLHWYPTLGITPLHCNLNQGVDFCFFLLLPINSSIFFTMPL